MGSIYPLSISTMVLLFPGFATVCGVYHLAAIFAAHAAIGTTIGGLVHYTATAKSCHAKERSARWFSFAGALGRQRRSWRGNAQSTETTTTPLLLYDNLLRRTLLVLHLV